MKNTLSISDSFVKTYTAGFRFGFNGKEKDNELYGIGNDYDYGMRMYYARLGRWFSIDNLFAKYPYQSPYSFVGNSPILKQEFDGMDYGVYTNHDTKTIIIKATYYTQKGDKDSYNSAVQATQYWNNQSGKFQYEVGSGNDKVRYNIKFELTVKQSANPEYDAIIEGKDSKGNYLGESNIYSVKKDDNPVFVDPKVKDEGGAGVTYQNGTHIAVQKSYESTDGVGAHEVGHTLGIDHKENGLMTVSVNDQNHSNSVDRFTIKDIFANVTKHDPTKGDGNATVHETGNKPANFDQGKVILKP
ncbi:MAG: hypothetical protein ABI199_03710 [Bacteroidia bacterium]